jgi:TPR repeat protein
VKKSHEFIMYALLIIPLYYVGILWLERTADKGYADAQHDLALRTLHGDGLSQDSHKAAELFTQAAEQNYAASQYELGRLYAAGNGVGQNYTLAMEWHTKAAYQGYARSLYEIALLHEGGLGVKKNLVKAHMFAQIASSNQHAKAIELKDRLTQQLSAEEIAQAQKMGKIWISDRK